LWSVLALPRGTIVHVHVSDGGSVLRKLILLRVARARGMTRVLTIHGSTFVEDAARHPRSVRSMLAAAQVVTSLTDDTAAVCARLSPRTTMVKLPNPSLSTREWATPVARTEPIVVFAGEVGHRKGTDVLAAAWHEVVARVPLARCLVFGPVVDYRPPRSSGLELCGPVEPETVARALGKARVVVLPSRAEAMPMILLEAMGAGRPFVATPVGQIPELARHGGILVPVGDSSALAEALVALLKDPAAAERLGDAGHAAAIRERSPRVISEALDRVYRMASANRRLS
jgi:glycosyltransferase involved in cell wall biosynthesis